MYGCPALSSWPACAVAARATAFSIVDIGINLAKTRLSVHGVDAHGKTSCRSHRLAPRCCGLCPVSSPPWSARKPAAPLMTCPAAQFHGRRHSPHGTALSKESEKPRQRCRSHLRSRRSTQHALSCGPCAKTATICWWEVGSAGRACRTPGQIDLACGAPVTCWTWMPLVLRWLRLGKLLASVSK